MVRKVRRHQTLDINYIFFSVICYSEIGTVSLQAHYEDYHQINEFKKVCDILACEERLKIIRHRAGFSYRERDCRFCGRLYPPYSSSNGGLKAHLKKCGGIWEVPTDEPNRKRKAPAVTVNASDEIKVEVVTAAATEEPVPAKPFIQGLVTPLNDNPFDLETQQLAPAPRIAENRLCDENTVLKKKLNEATNENYRLSVKLSKIQNENKWLEERNTELLKDKEALELKVRKLLNDDRQKIVENSELKEQMKQLKNSFTLGRPERKKLNRFKRTPLKNRENSQDETSSSERVQEYSRLSGFISHNIRFVKDSLNFILDRNIYCIRTCIK